MRGNEIAEKYEMNLNTVKTKIRKARKMLKEAVLTKNPHMVDKLGEYF
jgi:DNA-directed RNA polymerase specialized sigma24 family protein